MKNYFLLLSVISFTLFGFSQEGKGRISYDIFVSSDDPQTAAYVDQMEGSILELYFDEDHIRSEMYLGEFMTTINIMKRGEDTTLTLLDGMMGKIAMKTTFDDLEDEQQLALSQREVELVDETKNVMGFKCKKAIVTTADDQESTIWYTEEILPSFRKGQYLYEEIPGTPLEIESTWGKMDLKMVAFEFKKKIKKPQNIFTLEIPNGYTVRTAEEMKAMRQGR